MEELLTPVSTSYRTSNRAAEEPLVEVPKLQDTPPKALRLSSPNEALEALRGGPDYSTLKSILKYLVHDAPVTSAFHLTRPSPLAAQIVNVLVSDIVPNYWEIINDGQENQPRKVTASTKEKNLLLLSLRSVTGLNAILARVKAVIQQTKEGKESTAGILSTDYLQYYLELMEALLQGNTIVTHLWNSLEIDIISTKKAVWREIVALLAGGKILNTAAESASIISESSSDIKSQSWITNGQLYSRWLSSNLIEAAKNFRSASNESWKPLSELLSKSLRLGYPDAVIEELLKLMLGSDDDRKEFLAFINSLQSYEQRTVMNCALRALSKHHLNNSRTTKDVEWWKEDSDVISAVAGYIKYMVSRAELRKSHLLTWLTSSSGAGVSDSVGIRRAAIVALSESKYDVEMILERSLQQFGDQLYIRHSPSIQQEVHCQVLLIAAGYVQRVAPLKLSIILRSSSYLNVVSNRLAASSERARFLGMIVGEVLSNLAEKPEKRMDFKMAELHSDEAKWYKSLSTIRDSIGSVHLLLSRPGALASSKTKIVATRLRTTRNPISTQSESEMIAIEELVDDESVEDDLVPHAKPDTDDEDSEDDPTLVQRNKPTAPVYIRDLIVYLRDTENYDHQKLGLQTASSLIRRKTGFGTEVSAHVEELAKLLIGTQDKFDIDNFHDMRLQGMIAVLLSQPSKMAPWFARTFFEGDYSVSQRASVLTVLSISARELGGMKDEDASLTSIKSPPRHSFPSKLLPERLHKVYATNQPNTIDSLSQQLSNSMIQPLAASLADKAAGPDILKVRTFSSRLAVEARRKPPTINTLSAIVANSFFFPLIGRFAAHLKAYGAKNVIFEPFLLSSYLKTLSLILHAGGSSTLQLPQMTSEFWDLLLSLRTHANNDRAVGEAIMFGILTLLEMSIDQRRLAEVHGRELIETQRWLEGVFQRLGSGSPEDDKLRSLAAGVLIRIRDMVEKYQALLVGDMSSF